MAAGHCTHNLKQTFKINNSRDSHNNKLSFLKYTYGPNGLDKETSTTGPILNGNSSNLG